MIYEWHGCHRYPFSKLPDFKRKFQWPNKYKIPGLVAASSFARSLRVIIFNKFSFFVKDKYCWDHSDPKYFFHPSMVDYSLTFLQMSIFPDSRWNPWLFPVFEYFFSWPFPDLWQPWVTSANLVPKGPRGLWKRDWNIVHICKMKNNEKPDSGTELPVEKKISWPLFVRAL